MLVEINLLPEKEPKKIGFIVFIVSLLLLSLMAGAFYFYQIQSINNQIKGINDQIALTKKIVTQLGKSEQTAAPTSSVDLLKIAIKKETENRVPTVPIIQHLNSLLPERGFILSFSLKDSGSLTISVQFDTATESANFLENLNQVGWIKTATLTSLTSTPLKDETSSTTDSTVGTKTLSNSANQYLPRYRGEFQIILKIEEAKKLPNEQSVDGTEMKGAVQR
jgi:Tfp pilus assembly protein PilN